MEPKPVTKPHQTHQESKKKKISPKESRLQALGRIRLKTGKKKVSISFAKAKNAAKYEIYRKKVRSSDGLRL